MLDKVPDAEAEGDGDGEPHRDVWAKVPGFFSILTAVTQDDHGQDDIDDDVGERIVLLFSRSGGSVFGVGHGNVKREGEIWKGPAESGPLAGKVGGKFTRSKWYFRWSGAHHKLASCGRKGTARLS